MVHGATVQDISRIADGGDVSGGVVDFRLIRVLLAVHVSTTRNRFAVMHLTTLAAAAVSHAQPACSSHLLAALLAARIAMLTAQAPPSS